MADVIDIPLTLQHLRPGEQWTLEGDEYAGLTWLSDTAKPTKAEIVAAYPAAVAAREAEEADRLAARESAIARFKKLGFTDAEIATLVLP